MKKKKNLKIIALVLCVMIVIYGAYVLSLSIAGRRADIPKLYFEGNISGMDHKADIRNITFTYDDGTSQTSGYATIKVQGTSSLSYAKKNYTINLFADEAHEEKLKIDLGWGAENKYCLKANWIDRTHARNVVTAKLASQVQSKYGLLTDAPRNGAVDGFPVSIYSNGVFLGLYTFNIPKDEWQFAMDGDNPNHIVFCGEDTDPAGLFHEPANLDSWSIEVGEESDETLAKFNRLVDFIMNSSDEAFMADMDQYLNLDAVINYYLLAEFGYMPDNVGKNMLVVTYDGLVWYPSLYDLDTTWGVDYKGEYVYDYQNTPVNLTANNLFDRLMQLYPKEVAQRYFELREEILTKENIMNLFNEFRADIPASLFALDGVRWGDGLLRTHSDLPGYDYDQIEAYLDYMIPVLDAKYEAIRSN